MEIEAYDASGTQVTPSTCTMDSTHSSSFVASNCIDGNYNTMCHNSGVGGWLQIDYGSYVEIASIVVYNRQVTLQVCHSMCEPSLTTAFMRATGLLLAPNSRSCHSVVVWCGPNRNDALAVSIFWG